MRKVVTGPMQFTPYRPWSKERKAAARERYAGMIRGERMPLPPMLALPAPPKLLALPPPAKKWQEPMLVETGVIRPDLFRKGRVLRLRAECGDETHVTLHYRQTLSGVFCDGRLYKFPKPLSFPAAELFVDVEPERIYIGAADGEFDDEVRAWPVPNLAHGEKERSMKDAPE